MTQEQTNAVQKINDAISELTEVRDDITNGNTRGNPRVAAPTLNAIAGIVREAAGELRPKRAKKP